MQEIKGDVKINGIAAKIDDPVKIGDVITTGAKSRAVFVLGENAFLIHENTRLALESDVHGPQERRVLTVIRILRGRMLAVFGRGRKKIYTKTAILGVRGTGIYIESEEKKTYVCTCYGRVNIMSVADPSASETVNTTYHESPRFVYGMDSEKRIVPATVFNHTDEELIMLESQVYRKPPFLEAVFKDFDDTNTY
jgi:hypothetical protein